MDFREALINLFKAATMKYMVFREALINLFKAATMKIITTTNTNTATGNIK